MDSPNFPVFYRDFDCAELSPQLILKALSRGAPVSFALAQFSIEHDFGQSRVLHARQVACPVQLHGQKHGLDAANVGSLQHFVVSHIVLPRDAYDGPVASLVKALQKLHLFPVQNPGLGAVKESGDHCCSEDQDLCCAVSDSSIHAFVDGQRSC